LQLDLQLLFVLAACLRHMLWLSFAPNVSDANASLQVDFGLQDEVTPEAATSSIPFACGGSAPSILCLWLANASALFFCKTGLEKERAPPCRARASTSAKAYAAALATRCCP
jgi:hypothetical protein